MSFARYFQGSPSIALGVGLCAAAISGCGSPSSPTQAPPEHLQNAESGGPDSPSCLKFIAKLPRSYFHDWVTVPEDPADLTSRRIRVFYYGNLLPGVTPVVFFNGGPTGNSRSSYRILSEQQGKHPEYAGIPWVYLDQRGTGCSDPYPEVNGLGDLPRLALYGSRGIVADAEAVRRKLIGDTPWKIFGQSYGGMVVHRYVSVAPLSVTAASSHGFALTEDPMVTLTQRIESQYKVVQSYLSQYPDDADELAALDSFLKPTLCFHPTLGEGTVCGKEVLEPIYSTLGFLTEWSYIHQWLTLMHKRGGIPQEWVDKVVFSPTSSKSFAALWADHVIWHNEMNFAQNTADNCAQVFKTLEAKGETPRSWYLNECQPRFESPSKQSKAIRYIGTLSQDLLLPEEFKKALLAHPEIQFNLYSGELDPYSPPAIFADELRVLGDWLHYTDFKATGHDGFFSEDQVWRDLMKP